MRSNCTCRSGSSSRKPERVRGFNFAIGVSSFMNRIRRAPERRRRGVKGFCKEPAPARNDLKRRSHPVSRGRKRLLSWCHPCSAAAEPPFCSGYGERAVYVSIPAAEAVFPPVLAVNAFSHGVFLCPAVSGLLMPVVAVLLMVSHFPKKVKRTARFPACSAAPPQAAPGACALVTR